MTNTVPAVDRAIRILNAFEKEGTEFGVSELSRELDINKSTVHGIVQTLQQYRLLEQTPDTRKYRLGPALIRLGSLARARRDLRAVAHPFLVELMQTTGETVLLGVFENDGITIIDKADPTNEMRITAAIGQRLPFCAGSFGRAFLAWMDRAEVTRLLASPGLKKFTCGSIASTKAYKTSLEETRALGYAVDDTEEYLEGVWAVSAPVRDFEGVVAAITVVAFTSRLTASEKKAICKATTRAAHQISARMGDPVAIE